MPVANPTVLRSRLAGIQTFSQLVAFLRDDIGWPIEREDFEDQTFEYTPEELGIDAKNAAKIQEIRRLRPISPHQPWGIFFVKFEPKRLPVVALRRILGSVALKKRASANAADRTAWRLDDLLFLSSYGEGDERQISFAHFAAPKEGDDLPALKVLGWDDLDTLPHLDAVARALGQHLTWPADDADREAWRAKWRAAFTLGHREVITTSKDLSLRLAELARAIHDRIVTALKVENDKGPLTKLMNAFRDALVHDLKAESFADMYAQTITYGLLSARITDPKRKTADDFASHLRTSPFLRELMEHFLRVGGRRGKAGGPGIDFDELGVSDVVELLDAANMEAVVQDFGDKNRKEDPVIHFYEHFLAAYNKKLKVQRGVFYTPQPVVSYIVRSVHELLQTEFGLADGLADTTTWGEMIERHPRLKLPPLTDEPGETRTISPDEPFVQILDPATGTATFLVEVIDVIFRTLSAKWQQLGLTEAQQLEEWNAYIPDHLLPRLHAYELMMAPYAIAHMKVSLKLAESGYRFASEERARIFLTNALEPWVRSPKFPGFEALAHEAAAVNEVKRHKRFTVVVGNPPYAKQSANRQSSAEALVAPFKVAVRAERNIQPLSDDYLKFIGFAVALAKSVERQIVGVITNRGFLGGLIHRGVREVLLETFEQLRVVDLHGDSNVGERAPDGCANENVFDIQQGVAITLAAKTGSEGASVKACDAWGTRDQKYRLLGRLKPHDGRWKTCGPDRPNFFFAPGGQAGSAAGQFVSLAEMMPQSNTGIKTHRDELVVDFDDRALLQRIRAFADPGRSDASIRAEFFGTEQRGPYQAGDNRDWSMATARRELQRSSPPSQRRIHEIDYRPFDRRFIYFDTAIIDFPREELMRHMEGGKNIALVASRQVPNGRFCHVLVTRRFIEMKTASHDRGTNLFPLFLSGGDPSLTGGGRRLNYSRAFLMRLSNALGMDRTEESGLPSGVLAQDIMNYTYACLHSPKYRELYSDELRVDFPRVPLPGGPDVFREIGRLGSELVALHLLESPKLERPIAEFVGNRAVEVERASWSRHTVWLDKEQTTGFRGVREEVWNFHIGGYQVCEKWLKDRKGRTLSKDDIAHYQKIVVALSETIRLMKEIDEVIEQYGGWPGAFQTGESKAAPAKVSPFRPRTVEPKPEERYVTCVPLVPLKVAAGAFGEGQAALEGDEVEWVEVGRGQRLRAGMFVAQVVGKSMEPEIPDGAYCLFRAPVEGSRQGKTVLVELRDAADPETGERYTVKRYESEKVEADGAWRHARITLRPANPEFQPIALEVEDEERLRVVAELVEVLRPPEEERAGGGGGDAAAGAERGDSIQPAGSNGPAAGRRRNDGGEEAPGNLLLFDSPEESAGGRKISDVEPAEAMCAIRDLFESSEAREGIDRESAIRAVARALGFARTGKDTRDAINSFLTAAARRGIVETRAGRPYLVARSIGEYDRNLLKDQFLASLGGYAWTDRDEAIRAFVRWMGYARTGPAINELARSLINGLLRERRLESADGAVRKAR